jgi:hypothetical protein
MLDIKISQDYTKVYVHIVLGKKCKEKVQWQGSNLAPAISTIKTNHYATQRITIK